VGFPETGETGIKVEVMFEQPLAAWGADFWGGATGEKLDVALLNGQGVELGVMQATARHSDEWEFLGFIAPPGESIKRVVLRSRRRYIGTVGEGFGMDNFAMKVAVGAEMCYADCEPSTGVGALDIFDFLCFQSRLAMLDPYACDCDTSSGAGVCDIFDFLCFQNAFDAGCP
jgi:hypothetical protein